jgi:putative flippase GtrA
MKAVTSVARRGAAPGTREENITKNNISPSTFVRWCKFNLVGGIGIAVQFAALFFLKSLLQFNYLVATAVAVEAAILHNLVWHERFAWADRTQTLRTQIVRPNGKSSYSDWLRRLLRFHLANGTISIVGNLALMKWMVGKMHANYLVANAIAIAVCSLANFMASEAWVFGKGEQSR